MSSMKLNSNSQTVTAQQLNKAQQGLREFMVRQDIGFHHLPTKKKNLWSDSFELGQKIRDQFQDLVVIGIGGSSLGVRVINEIFAQPQDAHRLHVCDNVDALEFSRLIATLPNLQKTAWLAISKSGSTLETLMVTDLANQIYKNRGLNFFDNFFSVTEKRASPLFDLSLANQRPSLEIPIDVGGRFSVLSPVGMLPAAFLGLNPEHFRKGAEAALNNSELISQVMAQVLASFERQEWVSLFWNYSSWMKNFGSWTQQLWAESLAKKTDIKNQPALRASTPLTAIGACDQHSILQQVMEGARDKFVIFTRVQSAENSELKLQRSLFAGNEYLQGRGLGDLLGAEALATSQALTQVGVSNLVLEVKDLSAQSLGEQFMFWQLVVAGLGQCLGLNAFDQPGVELGKRLARKILQT